MYAKHVAHSTEHRQAHASVKRDNVQHTQANMHPLWLLPFRSIRLLVGHAPMVLKRMEARCLGTHRAPRARLRWAVSTATASRALISARRVMPQISTCSNSWLGRGWRGLRKAAGSSRCLPPHAALFSQPKGGRQTQPSGSAPLYHPGMLRGLLRGGASWAVQKNEWSWMLM